MERPTKVLSLHQMGTSAYPRFAIGDSFLQFFDGRGWTLDASKALLFSDSNFACQEMQRLLMIDYANMPMRRYRAPVYIDLFSDRPVPLEELQDWLVKVSKLLIDSPTHGNGPMAGSLGLARINWTELEEVKP
jgi:hypothetical protein